MRAIAVDLDLGGHRKTHRVVERAETADARFVLGFLVAELVARKSQHHQSGLAVVAPQLFQPGVLRGESAARGDVDDQQHVAGEIGQRQRVAVDVGGGEIEGGGHRVLLSGGGLSRIARSAGV